MECRQTNFHDKEFSGRPSVVPDRFKSKVKVKIQGDGGNPQLFVVYYTHSH